MMPQAIDQGGSERAKIKMLRELVAQMIKLMNSGEGDAPVDLTEAVESAKEEPAEGALEMPAEEGLTEELEEEPASETFARMMQERPKGIPTGKSRVVIAATAKSAPKKGRGKGMSIG